MFIRSKYITNSSTTAFVCFGNLYRQPELDGIYDRIRLLYEQHKDTYKASHSWAKEQLNDLNDLREFIMWLYQKEYEKKHPESRIGWNDNGIERTYVKTPVKITTCDLDRHDPDDYYMIFYVLCRSCDWEPEGFDPYEMSPEEVQKYIDEFCDMFELPKGSAKWWVEGYGL